MKRILLDTSIIIDFLRVKDKRNSHLFKLVEHECDLNISIITHTELHSGRSIWESKRRQKELDEILSYFNIIPFNLDISKKAGEIKAKNNLDLIDSVIAATAIENKLDFATLNIKDFKNIKGLKVIDL